MAVGLPRKRAPYRATPIPATGRIKPLLKKPRSILVKAPKVARVKAGF